MTARKSSIVLAYMYPENTPKFDSRPENPTDAVQGTQNYKTLNAGTCNNELKLENKFPAMPPKTIGDDRFRWQRRLVRLDNIPERFCIQDTITKLATGYGSRQESSPCNWDCWIRNRTSLFAVEIMFKTTPFCPMSVSKTHFSHEQSNEMKTCCCVINPETIWFENWSLIVVINLLNSFRVKWSLLGQPWWSHCETWASELWSGYVFLLSPINTRCQIPFSPQFKLSTFTLLCFYIWFWCLELAPFTVH